MGSTAQTLTSACVGAPRIFRSYTAFKWFAVPVYSKTSYQPIFLSQPLRTEFRPTHPRDARLAPDVDSSLVVELAPRDVRVVQQRILPVGSTHLLGVRKVLLLYYVEEKTSHIYKKRQTPSLYRGDNVSLLSRTERENPFSIEEERLFLFSIERGDTPSL